MHSQTASCTPEPPCVTTNHFESQQANRCTRMLHRSNLQVVLWGHRSRPTHSRIPSPGQAVKAVGPCPEARRGARRGASRGLDRPPRPGILRDARTPHMPIESPRLRSSSQRMPSPITMPETVRPNSFSITGRHGTSVNSLDRVSTKAYLPLTSSTAPL